MPGEQDLVERREQQPPTSCHAGPLQLVPQWAVAFKAAAHLCWMMPSISSADLPLAHTMKMWPNFAW